MARSPRIRKGMPSVQLTKKEFAERFRSRFYDPVFDEVSSEIETIIEKAWDGYSHYRKSPRARRAGHGFADPDFELPLEWLKTRKAIQLAEQRQKAQQSASRILLVNGSSRSDQSCPGEMSKTFRLVSIAKQVISAAKGFDVDLLDLSRLPSEYGRLIYPCKSCVSTAMPLCHWPCSCYPNHAMGQTGDWMAEIYPRWVSAHGIMIVCPVHWYQTPSSLNLFTGLRFEGKVNASPMNLRRIPCFPNTKDCRGALRRDKASFDRPLLLLVLGLICCRRTNHRRYPRYALWNCPAADQELAPMIHAQ